MGRHIDLYLLLLLGLYIHTQALNAQSFVEHAAPSQETQCAGFPERLRRGGWWMGVCGTAETAATLSHERSSFDLIIWEGQSAFVDEESL